MASLFPATIPLKYHQNVLNNKYVPGGKSLIMPYLDPWWEFTVQFIPRSIAPNVLTLTGFLILMSAVCIWFYYDPYLSPYHGTDPPPFACFYFAFAWFVAQTLDSIDGKHARNTKNSSHLGQLFDHGIDAIVSGFAIAPLLSFQATFDPENNGMICLCALLMNQIIFYIMNWKGRHICKFDFGIIGVDEAQIWGQFLYCFHGMFGTSIFAYPLVVWGEVCGVSALIVIHCISGNYDVYKFYEDNPSQKHFYGDVFYEFGNVLVFQVSLCFWNMVGVFELYPVMFITSMAFTFAHLVHKLIVCEVTKQHCDKIQLIIVPYILVAVCTVVEVLFNTSVIFGISMKDRKVMVGILVWSTLVMLRYAIQTMIELSNILKIRIFLINPPEVRFTH